MKDQPLRRQNQVMARAHTHKLVVLRKPTGDTRPILVESLWLKAIRHMILQEARAALEPHIARQFGIGVPQGGLLKF